MTASHILDAVGLVQLPPLSTSHVSQLCDALGDLVALGGQRPGKFEFIDRQPALFTYVWEFDVVPQLLREFCGDHARLDNHFGFNYPGQGVGPNIHGGPGSERRSVWWHTAPSCSHTTNLKVGVALQPHAGFGFLPGSHKASSLQAAAHATPAELQRPQFVPGSVVVFTDALVHGTIESPDTRTMLYYTFTPGHVAWAQYREPAWREQLPPQRQRFIRPPGIVAINPADRTTIQYLPPTFD